MCGGCIGIAAILLEKDRERLAGMLDRIMRTMDCFLAGFSASGGCLEGIGYWVYGFGYYTYFAALLSDFTNGALDLFQGAHLQRIVAFPEAVSLGEDRFVNYSDAAEQAIIHPGLGSYLSGRFNQPIPALSQPSFHADHIYRWSHISRDLLWTKPAYLFPASTTGSFYLKDISWVIDRRLSNGQMLAFAARGGHNDEPHNHNDLGHFMLHLGGESILTDLGAGLYTRQYFGTERYEALHTGSQGHSVPLINGHTQAAGRQFKAQPVGYDRQTDKVQFTLDLTQAYEPTAGLASFTRSFVWSVNESVNEHEAAATHSATLTLTDSFRFTAAPGTVEECFISYVSPVLTAGAVTWRGQNGTVTLHFKPEQFAPHIDQLETQTHYGESITVFRLRLQTRQPAIYHQAALTFTCQL